jgi:hypothetical protein
MKPTREQVFNKFGGLCAYSGTPLEQDWQIEHLTPKWMFIEGKAKGDPNHIDNLLPVQKTINHYKGGLRLDEFRNWYLGELHLRLAKLPKNSKSLKAIKRKEYLLKVAAYFGITDKKPFNKVFYFETNKNNG